MIYANKPIHTSFGDSVNVRIVVNGYAISIAMDDSCGKMNQLSRASFCIFRLTTAVEDGEDVTKQLMDSDEVLWCNSDDLMRAMVACQNAPTGWLKL